MPGTVAIVGATGTIGSTLAKRMVQQQRPLLLLGRSADKLAKLASELEQPWATVDVHDSQAFEDQVREAVPPSAPLDGLVNCVGSLLLKPVHSTSDDEFRETLETNLFSAFCIVRAGAKLMREQGGSIVLFASAAAEIGIQNHEAIAAAKAGVIGLARSAAASYATHGIRVNAVSPGLIRTQLTRRIWENASAASASVDMHALGRLGEPEDVVSLAAWLLAPENNWITGQVIGVDGGLGHLLPRKRVRP